MENNKQTTSERISSPTASQTDIKLQKGCDGGSSCAAPCSPRYTVIDWERPVYTINTDNMSVDEAKRAVKKAMKHFMNPVAHA